MTTIQVKALLYGLQDCTIALINAIKIADEPELERKKHLWDVLEDLKRDIADSMSILPPEE